MGIPDEAYDGQHVIGNRRVHVPKVGRVPAAVFSGVMPREQKIGDTPGLSGILPGNLKQPREGKPALLLIFGCQVQMRSLFPGLLNQANLAVWNPRRGAE